MLRGEIVLENGDRCEFFLSDQNVRKLELRVRKQNEYERENGMSERWNMADELSFMAEEVLAYDPDPAENETPEVATPGESR